MQEILLTLVAILIIFIVYRNSSRKESLDPVAQAPETSTMTVKKNDYDGMPIRDMESGDNDFVAYNNAILLSGEDPELMIPGLTKETCLETCRNTPDCKMAVIYDQKDKCSNDPGSCKLYDMAHSKDHMVFAGDEIYSDHTLSRQGTQTYSVSDTAMCKQIAQGKPATFFTDDFGRFFCMVKKDSRALGDTYIKRNMK